MQEIHRERSAGKGLTMKKTKRRRSGLLRTTAASRSSFKFGSFIMLAAVDSYSSKTSKREFSLVMISPVSGTVSESNDDESPWPWNKQDTHIGGSKLPRECRVDHIGGSKDQLMNVELDNNEDNQQQQLVLKLNSFGFPPKLNSFGVPPPRYHDSRQIVGSCNGLVCLYDENVNEVSLWNPHTKEHRILPKPKIFSETWNQHLIAFGFDVETNDYKVVLLIGPESMDYRLVAPIDCLCRVQVYSLSTDSWRLLEGIVSLPGDPDSLQSVLYLNGSCFFLANFFHTKQQPCFPESNRFIISFDFTKEIFNAIQLPDHRRDHKLYLSSLGDKIALFTKSYHNNAGTCEEFNIWLLKEHGSSNINSIVNKESWKKLHFFQIKHERTGESTIPIGLSNDGQFALLRTCGSNAFGKKVKLYHLISKEVKRSFLFCSSMFSKAHAYKPSLVSIIGGNGAAAAATADRVIGNDATNL